MVSSRHERRGIKNRVKNQPKLVLSPHEVYWGKAVASCPREGCFKLSTGKASFWLQWSSVCDVPGRDWEYWIILPSHGPHSFFFFSFASPQCQVRRDSSFLQQGLDLLCAHVCLRVCRRDFCDLFTETFPGFVFLCAWIFGLPGLPNQCLYSALFLFLSYLLWFEVVLYTVLESFPLGF